MAGPGHFDAHAELYDRARPPYPQELWARLTALGLLGPGTRVIELGAGSGQATLPLIEAGAEVTAVEPGPQLAGLLRRRAPEAKVLVDTAERVPLPAAGYDLAVAATAVHWFDLDAVLEKLHSALVPGGAFAVWRNVYGDPAAPLTPFRARIAEITASRDQPGRPGPREDDTEAWARLLTAGGLFRREHTEHFRWSIRLSSEQVRELFTTFSDWSPAEAEHAAQAVDELGGSVDEHYRTTLLVVRREESPSAERDDEGRVTP